MSQSASDLDSGVPSKDSQDIPDLPYCDISQEPCFEG